MKTTNVGSKKKGATFAVPSVFGQAKTQELNPDYMSIYAKGYRAGQRVKREEILVALGFKKT